MADVKIVLKGVDEAKGVIDGVASALGGLGQVAGAIASAGLAALATGVAAVGAGLAYSISQALDAEKTLARLESVIKSTGGVAGLTSAEAQDLATQFMNLAGGSDDAVLAIQEMALRMGTVTADQMPAFIQTTLDLAAATGTDAVNAARLLAQAQEDPISALTRFRRMGILFSDGLEQQIKQMVAAGDTGGAMALVMDRLAEATGGAAAANAETLAGKWEIFTGNIAEAAETIGAAFMPVLHTLFDEVIAPAIPLIAELAAGFGAFISALFSGDMLAGFSALYDALAKVFGHDTAAQIMGFVSGAQEQFDVFIGGIQPLIDAAGRMAGAFLESMPMISRYVADMVAFVVRQIEILAPTLITNTTELLDQLTLFWQRHGETIMQVVNGAFRIIAATVGGALVLLSGLLTAGMQIINGDWEGAWETMKGTLRAFMEGALAIVNTNFVSFQTTWANNFQMMSDVLSFSLQTMSDNLNAWLNTTSAQMIVTWSGIWANLGTIAMSVIQPIIDAVVHLYSLIANIPGVPGGKYEPSGSSTSTTNTSNSTTNNYYGVGADVAAGYTRAAAGAF